MPIIQALDRALKIMDLFDEYTTELKITEISARMELHKSTVHSLLKTLQMHGYINQDVETGKYKLGLKLLEKGQLMLQSLDIRTAARKHLVALSEQTGQTTHLVILDGKEGVYLDKVEGEKAAIRYSRIGRRISLHSSAVGKVLSAFRTKDEIDALLRNYQFSKITDVTITGKDAFVNELNQVREQGYSIDNQENEPGVRCAAAPIFEHNGSIVAAISISTLLSTVDDSLFKAYIALLKKEAEAISLTLGFRHV
ncbi:IclR family transcriptional regulator [Paenibacillus sp. CGMCC 1.16610]|uniref:Helix-turn-helix domain-containing protein n=1 Tax=Paenibacillus anseongense TaxID=2682845 RepID=A0ABW9UEX6_9BACL|nr:MULTISPECIES: IclR family transcriptional regulator [Paenibacillus]MBA2943660.1 IclR family transcriptional regulator [Paenibacillus sp. CGMCC 1.16610]MVQ37566.1 helix-turn-helix domain-containing protein [Paenibacillus anseongense]